MARICAGFILIGRNHQATRVGNLAPNFLQALIGGLQHCADPLPLRVECGSPCLLHQVFGEGLAQTRGVNIARIRPPRHLPRIGHEEHRTNNEVTKGITIAVGEVSFRALDPLLVFFVAHKRNGRSVRAERSTGQRKAARGPVKGFTNTIAPRKRITRVVNLVKDHQGAVEARAGGVNHRIGGNLRVGDSNPIKVRTRHALRVRERGIYVDPNAPSCLGPLTFEVFGRAHDRNFFNDAGAHELDGNPQGEGRLTRAGGSNRKKILW